MSSRSLRRTVSVGLLAAMAVTAAASDANAEPPAAGLRTTTFQLEPFVDGVVRVIDRAAGKIVLRHAAIENLGIPPMTMIFRVKDTRLIEALESGATVRFMADRVEGTFTITHIERR